MFWGNSGWTLGGDFAATLWQLRGVGPVNPLSHLADFTGQNQLLEFQKPHNSKATADLTGLTGFVAPTETHLPGLAGANALSAQSLREFQYPIRAFGRANWEFEVHYE